MSGISNQHHLSNLRTTRTRLVLLNKRFVNKSNLLPYMSALPSEDRRAFPSDLKKSVYYKEAFVGNKPFPSGKVIKNLGSKLTTPIENWSIIRIYIVSAGFVQKYLNCTCT